MNVGTPGTGLGGIFYVLSTMFMLVAELAHTLRGQSSLARWRFVLGQVGIAIGIVATVAITTMLVSYLLPGVSRPLAVDWYILPVVHQPALHMLVLVGVLVLVTISPLLLVMLVVQGLRLALTAQRNGSSMRPTTRARGRRTY